MATEAIPEIKHPPYYISVGMMLAVVTGPAAFLVAWGYCIYTYGFLFGFGLGWIPAIILGLLVAGGTVLLWAPWLLGLLLLALAWFRI
jgi:hypothetical protein